MKKKSFPQLHSIRSKLLLPYPLNITPKVGGTLPPKLVIDITPKVGGTLPPKLVIDITPKVGGTLPPKLAIDITPTLGVSLRRIIFVVSEH